ncbi:MAG TPA: ribosomal protein S18-alanine N-acetyltransferase [Burkholderiaceae bacterium]|jgi:ribosomal-protein-alanine N-acetyltransferase|nr:ribosomal protein S18-alanine N-acetyltransferase [Burkholderiaceae bacterium]
MSAVARPDEPVLRPLLAADLNQVMRIEIDVYPFPWTRGNFEDALRAGYTAWAMLDGVGSMIAYAIAMLVVDEAHLLNLSVARGFQRLGYGWRMLEWMAQCTRDYGARSLLLEVRPSNEAGLRLYQRYGFERIGVRPGYYPALGGREDAVVMRVPL